MPTAIRSTGKAASPAGQGKQLPTYSHHSHKGKYGTLLNTPPATLRHRWGRWSVGTLGSQQHGQSSVCWLSFSRLARRNGLLCAPSRPTLSSLRGSPAPSTAPPRPSAAPSCPRRAFLGLPPARPRRKGWGATRDGTGLRLPAETQKFPRD